MALIIKKTLAYITPAKLYLLEAGRCFFVNLVLNLSLHFATYVYCSIVVTCLERADGFALLCVMFY